MLNYPFSKCGRLPNYAWLTGVKICWFNAQIFQRPSTKHSFRVSFLAHNVDWICHFWSGVLAELGEGGRWLLFIGDTRVIAGVCLCEHQDGPQIRRVRLIHRWEGSFVFFMILYYHSKQIKACPRVYISYLLYIRKSCLKYLKYDTGRKSFTELKVQVTTVVISLGI